MKKNIKKLLGLFVTIGLLFTNIIVANAASASLSISSGTSTIVVGNSFTVTAKLSSGSALGTWEWTMDYDKSKFKLTSGEANVVGYGDGSKKSVSYSYTFKAIGTGSGKIGVKSYSALQYSDKSEYSLSVGSKTVKVITQAEKQASYSKNNNLKSLSVNGYTLSPAFNNNTLEYKVEVPANTEKITIAATKEDSKASISGAGEFQVAEGENKFQITVTAENGGTKTFAIIVNVIDNNPIEVTINKNKYTVVKRSSLLTSPDGYEVKELTINEIVVPAFYSEITKYTLVGLKNENGDINLYIYDDKNNKYTKYSEIKLNQIKILPLELDKTFDKNYKKSTITIGEVSVDGFSLPKSNYFIIHAKDLGTGKEDYYLYDKSNNSIIKYTNEEALIYKKLSDKYFKIILLLGGETAIIFIVLIGMLINKISKKKKKKTLTILDDKYDKVESKKEIDNTKIKEEKEEEKEEAKESKQNTEDIKIEIIEEPKKKKNKKK